MMTENTENLDELLSRFLDEHESHVAAEDIRLGENLLASFSVPAPDAAVIEAIKVQIELRLRAQQKQRFIRSMAQKIAVAAIIIVVAMAGLKFLVEPGPEVGDVSKVSQEFIWEDESEPAGDEQLAVLTAQIDEVEADMLAIRLGENGGESNLLLTDLEMEMIEINGDFWKG
jgi:hypothetical protein